MIFIYICDYKSTNSWLAKKDYSLEWPAYQDKCLDGHYISTYVLSLISVILKSQKIWIYIWEALIRRRTRTRSVRAQIKGNDCIGRSRVNGFCNTGNCQPPPLPPGIHLLIQIYIMVLSWLCLSNNEIIHTCVSKYCSTSTKLARH